MTVAVTVSPGRYPVRVSALNQGITPGTTTLQPGDDRQFFIAGNSQLLVQEVSMTGEDTAAPA